MSSRSRCYSGWPSRSARCVRCVLCVLRVLHVLRALLVLFLFPPLPLLLLTSSSCRRSPDYFSLNFVDADVVTLVVLRDPLLLLVLLVFLLLQRVCRGRCVHCILTAYRPHPTAPAPHRSRCTPTYPPAGSRPSTSTPATHTGTVSSRRPFCRCRLWCPDC